LPRIHGDIRVRLKLARDAELILDRKCFYVVYIPLGRGTKGEETGFDPFDFQIISKPKASLNF